MLYSCTHVASVGIEWLIKTSLCYNRIRRTMPQ